MVPGEYVLDVPLAGLAAGDYEIDVRARAAGVDTREAVSFRVTP